MKMDSTAKFILRFLTKAIKSLYLIAKYTLARQVQSQSWHQMVLLNHLPSHNIQKLVPLNHKKKKKKKKKNNNKQNTTKMKSKKSYINLAQYLCPQRQQQNNHHRVL